MECGDVAESVRDFVGAASSRATPARAIGIGFFPEVELSGKAAPKQWLGSHGYTGRDASPHSLLRRATSDRANLPTAWAKSALRIGKICRLGMARGLGFWHGGNAS